MLGTKFVEEYEGLTVSGRGRVVQHWEVVEEKPLNSFNCKLISSSAIMGEPNPEYRELFTKQSIEDCLRKWQ